MPSQPRYAGRLPLQDRTEHADAIEAHMDVGAHGLRLPEVLAVNNGDLSCCRVTVVEQPSIDPDTPCSCRPNCHRADNSGYR